MRILIYSSIITVVHLFSVYAQSTWDIEVDVLQAALVKKEMTPDYSLAIRKRSSRALTRNSVEDQILLQRLLENENFITLKSTNPTTFINIVAACLNVQILNSQFEAAFSIYDTLSDADRDLLWKPISGAQYDLSDLFLLTSLIALDLKFENRARAVKQIELIKQNLPEDDYYMNNSVISSLHELVYEELSKEQVYDHFVYGRLISEEERRLASVPDKLVTVKARPNDPLYNEDFQYIEHNPNSLRTDRGFFTYDQSPILNVIQADYLLKRGFRTGSRYLKRKSGIHPLSTTSEYRKYKEYFDNTFDVEVAKLRTKIARARKANQTRPLIDNGSQIDYSYLQNETKPEVYTEKLLPENLRSDDVKILRESMDYPFDANVPYPINRFDIRRVDVHGDVIAIIYKQGDVFTFMENEHPEYWLYLSRNGGSRWEEPIYLGLIENLPYHVTETSNLPIIGMEGISIEVVTSKNIEEHINDGPWKFERDRENIYVTATWDVLLADHDKDGLSDLYEHSIGLSYKSADTDKDGMRDDVDPVPNVPYEPLAGNEKELASYFFDKVLNKYGKYEFHEYISKNINLKKLTPGRVSYLFTDPQLFRYLNPPHRVLISNSPLFSERLSEYKKANYMSVETILDFPERKRRYFDWFGRGSRGFIEVYTKNGAFNIIRLGEIIYD